MRTLSLLVAVLAASLLIADEPAPRSKALTRAQVTQGWIALYDGETTFGWQAPDGSKWAVAKNLLSAEGDKEVILASTTAFDNYEIEVDFYAKKPCDLLVNAKLNAGKLEGNPVKLEPTGLGKGTIKVQVQAGKVRGVQSMISNDPLGLTGGGTGFKMAQNPNEKMVTTPGQIGFRGQGLVLRGVRLRSLESKSLFDGKTLDGWKVFEGKKGKFTVEGGAIAVKDGPGDLATVGEYADFMFQFECQTNGKGLNSGIFFRSIPGQYQMGYEAQIQNAWLDKVKTIEVDAFDPKTGEAKGKEKIDTLASDFGTGAVYRRIPARKQLADDNEWFAMTVVANGRHISTWVNGIQAVDWDDPRKEDENPRKGYRAGKGGLSIQAHDPTTDLLFKNLRIADYSKP